MYHYQQRCVFTIYERKPKQNKTLKSLSNFYLMRRDVTRRYKQRNHIQLYNIYINLFTHKNTVGVQNIYNIHIHPSLCVSQNVTEGELCVPSQYTYTKCGDTPFYLI